jgi:hypothetical protein
MSKIDPFVLVFLAILLTVAVCYVAECWKGGKCAEAGLVQKKVDAQVIWVKPEDIPAAEKK